MTHDELVEKVARALYEAQQYRFGEWSNLDESYQKYFRNIAPTAIVVVLAEAAKVIHEMPLSHSGNAAKTALECADAIRKLRG